MFAFTGGKITYDYVESGTHVYIRSEKGNVGLGKRGADVLECEVKLFGDQFRRAR